MLIVAEQINDDGVQMSEHLTETNDSFDSYHRLLGISPQEQPPSSYRLLGIDLFESDREVIDAAANRQSVYLKGCCCGEHAAFAEQLLNEVAVARLRLLNPASKQRYDSELRAALSQSGRESLELVPNQSLPALPVKPTAPAVRVRSRSQKNHSGVLKLMLGIFVPSILSLLGAWKFGLTDTGGVQRGVSQANLPTPNRSELSSASEQPEITPQAAPNPPFITKLKPDSRPTGSISEPGSQTMPASVNAPVQDTGGSRFFDIKSEPEPRTASDSDPGTKTSSEVKERLESFRAMAQDAYESGQRHGNLPTSDHYRGARIAVPENELEDARVKVQKTLATEIREAQSPHDKQHFATRCYELALESEPPADKYVLLQLAKDSFVDAGDFNGAMLTMDTMESRFETDPFDDRVATLIKLVPKMYRPSDQVSAADRADALIATAIQQDRYKAAIELAASGKKIAMEFRNISMSNKFQMLSDRATLLQNAQPTVQAARDRLQSEPDNAKAIEYLGRYLCFGKSDWTAGLPLLQRAENAILAGLARSELQNPQSTLAFNELGNLWWELASISKSDEVLARESQRRAVHWYRQATASGLKGLPKAAAESRLARFESEHAGEIAAQNSPNVDNREPTPPRGVPREAIYFNGNWYLFSQKMVKFAEAVAFATQAGGRLVVVRSQAENDFLVEHIKGRLWLGMMLKDGTWYDSLGEKQYFFLWDKQNQQPDGRTNEVFAAIFWRTNFWHDYAEDSLYFAVEWGKE
ncbi:lectin-like protein [Neorhodopirellula pilleata]|uniref:C-type lectin domain-containing protein n=1 Tax=Neorhodopirellula pilleata TaxID=2714738 RepID=A0A5C6AUB3_9BACT|nr:lectin-like protein [Neorhodopirellula pilleata]TWU03585.1 hypothetical protein Pla100_05130 [Neorhodopirellula pilleata]